MAIDIDKMKRQFRDKQRKQRAEALHGLEELEILTHCVEGCNEEASRLIRLMYWKISRVHALLEGRDTDGHDIEIAECEQSSICQ